MRRSLLLLLAIALIGTPVIARADSMMETENPTEYTQEDSFPLRVASYFVTPVGFVLEWTVARPLHYIASETFLAPALDSEYSEEGAPAPVAELPPPDYLPVDEGMEPATKKLHEESLSPEPARSPASSESQPSAPAPPASDSGRQPILH